MSWLDTLEQVRKRDFGKAPRKDVEKAARDVVNMCSYACAVVSVSPVPFSDAVLMLPIQTAMVMTVGHIHGRRLTQAAAKDLLVELGTLMGASFLARQGIKAILPVLGALLTVPAAFAANWAIGRVAMAYFEDRDAPKEKLREVYAQARAEAKGIFSMEGFRSFRRRHEADVKAVAEAPAAPTAPRRKAAPKKARRKPARKKAPVPPPEPPPAAG